MSKDMQEIDGVCLRGLSGLVEWMAQIRKKEDVPEALLCNVTSLEQLQLKKERIELSPYKGQAGKKYN